VSLSEARRDLPILELVSSTTVESGQGRRL
jgi:hypothetical protein